MISVTEMMKMLRERVPDDPAFQDPEFELFSQLLEKFVPPRSQAVYNVIACSGICFTAIEVGIMRGDPDNPEIVISERIQADVLYGGQCKRYLFSWY